MNRRLSMALTAYGVGNQAFLLWALEPLKERVSDVLPPGMTVGEVRLLGLSLEGFAVRDTAHAAGWLPQVVFLVVSGLLTYGVLRGSAGIRPRFRSVLALAGASLLAAGTALLVAPALDPDSSLLPAYGEWVLRAQLGEVPAAAAQFALLTLWWPLVPWLLLWRYRNWQPVRTYLRNAEDAVEDAASPERPTGPVSPTGPTGLANSVEPVGPVGPVGSTGPARPVNLADPDSPADPDDHADPDRPVRPGSPERPGPRAVSARERRHIVCAGLIPAVLLAVAGGPVLRHIRVRHLSQGAPGSPDASVTFDPDLWDSYTPPQLVEEWSGVLYPALRLRPLRTELDVGWSVTLVVCLVFLGALALALRAVATRSAGLLRRAPAEAGRAPASGGPAAYLGIVMKGWYATLLAAAVAAFVEGRLLRWFAPRRESGPAATDHLGVALGDAVRFGAAWGWATGLACLAVVLVMMRRATPVVPQAGGDEEQPDREVGEQPDRGVGKQPVRECEEQSAHGE
ncbi:hypothetical protein [Streptomyces sp. V2I9]|uniref:hypothetical protein n=1 Tax=Streptomyces sp. V2I9 TaxID=3042304 RepID=UPI00277DAD6D|nr:hypothetical protein [Streptomyces sp. V2I9]MDQ0986736.1 hypothetical protein [Streptomyces sp. V2I9]